MKKLYITTYRSSDIQFSFSEEPSAAAEFEVELDDELVEKWLKARQQYGEIEEYLDLTRQMIKRAVRK